MMIDTRAIRESSVPLLISLGGLLLMSSTLYKSIDNEFISPMHYIFILNSILCFKNNIELNYADIMSSTVRKVAISKKSISSVLLLEYVFDCGLRMFGLSFATSLVIGICACYTNVIDGIMTYNLKENFVFGVATILSSVFSGICGSISTFISVVLCIAMSVVFDFNPDNIVLPVIASFADYISTISLLYFSKNMYLMVFEVFPDIPRKGSLVISDMIKSIFITNCLLIVFLGAVLVLLYFHSCERQTPKLFGLWSLLNAFAITFLAGSFIEIISKKNKWLGSIIPLFNGLSGSVALIYTSQITTYNNIKESTERERATEIDLDGNDDSILDNPNSLRTLNTLLIIASVLAIISSVCIKAVFQDILLKHIIVTGVMLVVEVFLLFNLINLFVFALKRYNMNISCDIVPLLNASSDLLGAVVLGSITIALSPL
ncbi:solute carrier family 41 [Nematocida sp. AWRm80]|nr:solute carrier family 41 [Nematocida sp. AWRm80]